jgi:hypothetical protein
MTTQRILSVLIFIVSMIGGKLAYDALFGESEIASFEEADWSLSRCLGVQYEAPFELAPMDLKLPEHIKIYVKEMNNYHFESKPIGFFISRAEYQPGVKPDIDGAVKGAVQNMQAQEGITDYAYVVSNIKKDFIDGRFIKGTCKVDEQDAEFVCQIFMKDLKLLQIMTMNLSFPENREIRDRILKSIRITL